MPIARSTKETFRFVLKDELNLPESERTTFVLRRLSTTQIMALQDLKDGDDIETGRWMMVALRSGLVGWNNFKFSDGTQAPFEPNKRAQLVHGVEVPAGGASEEALNLLDAPAAAEIATAVIHGNVLSIPELGN